MGVKKQKKSLTVAPFECAWQQELKFEEAGRGCVAFEASARNDVTVVFREQVGSQHYHYKTDNSPNYTIVLGSHRNRRLKIEVNGKTVVDVAGIGLCCSEEFQSYWISICDGLICIGKGRYPFQHLVFQWLDSKPNCSVQYVGLSSWDKHVGYRNVSVLPWAQHHKFLWKHVDHIGYEGWGEEEEEELEMGIDDYEVWGPGNFLESWDLSDMFFIVGSEEKMVPAHMVILAMAGNFSFNLSNENSIRLPSATYPVLHAFLHYIYTGQTEIAESQLSSLRDLSKQFQVLPLLEQCEEMMDRLETNEQSFEPNKKVELAYSSSGMQRCTVFPCELPINRQKLKEFLLTGEHSDVNIHIDHHLVAHAHKLILSLWSVPFTKMFTNGMTESTSSNIYLKDVSAEAFLGMLQYMYDGELEMKDRNEMGTLLLEILLLADQFSVMFLQRECCKILLEGFSEDLVCLILEVVSSIPSCKLIKETCERNFSRHFDYYTTSSTDFVFLEEETFRNILQHPDLTVTSEERVLDAILLWCMQAGKVYGWEAVDELLKSSTVELFFGERFKSLAALLPLVRFPLMQSTMLKKLETSHLSSQVPVLEHLVMEAVRHDFELTRTNQNVRFQHRRSSFKKLHYICDGDKNGVIYFSGTSYGEHQWVNPVLAKKITVTASSPPSRYTDPKALVSRTYLATSYAGPRVQNGHNCAWWMVDIGQDHQLMCNYYTLRQDGSTAYMRWWNLQGSMDAENWIDLRVHENDQTICKHGQFASWPIHGPTALLPFRFFRVVLMGPTTCLSNQWNLCICYLELYGYFH